MRPDQRPFYAQGKERAALSVLRIEEQSEKSEKDFEMYNKCEASW